MMHFQCTKSSIFDWKVRRLGMCERVKTRNDNGLRIWIFLQKLPFSVGKKCFKDIQEVQYTISIRYITNIYDFVWFQRSYGSMKSVSFFSSIDLQFNFLTYISCFNYSPLMVCKYSSEHLKI